MSAERSSNYTSDIPYWLSWVFLLLQLRTTTIYIAKTGLVNHSSAKGLRKCWSLLKCIGDRRVHPASTSASFVLFGPLKHFLKWANAADLSVSVLFLHGSNLDQNALVLSFKRWHARILSLTISSKHFQAKVCAGTFSLMSQNFLEKLCSISTFTATLSSDRIYYFKSSAESHLVLATEKYMVRGRPNYLRLPTLQEVKPKPWDRVGAAPGSKWFLGSEIGAHTDTQISSKRGINIELFNMWLQGGYLFHTIKTYIWRCWPAPPTYIIVTILLFLLQTPVPPLPSFSFHFHSILPHSWCSTFLSSGVRRDSLISWSSPSPRIKWPAVLCQLTRCVSR